MSTFSKQMFSQAVSGTFIQVLATATPGTLIHTAGLTGEPAGSISEVWLWACNTNNAPILATIEWGGTTSGFVNKVTVPAQEGLFQIAPGIPILSGVSIRVWTSGTASTSGLNIAGFINRAS